MRAEVEKKFDDAIREVFKNRSQVVNFLLRHERKNICIDNLCSEILKCEKHHFSINFDAGKYDYVIKEVAKMFAQSSLGYLEQSIMSRAAKVARETEANKYKEAEAELQEYTDEATTSKLLSFPGKVCQ